MSFGTKSGAEVDLRAAVVADQPARLPRKGCSIFSINNAMIRSCSCGGDQTPVV